MSLSSTVSLTGSRMVTTTFGNQRRRTCEGPSRLNGVDLRASETSRGPARAVVDLDQPAGDGDAPLGKDHQRLARLDHVDQRAGRHRFRRVERHGAGEAQERLDPPALSDAVVDGE